MAEILSQDEIDSLLTALTTGEVSAEELKKEDRKKKIRIYDFRRPNKFSKEQINTFRVIYENYSRLVATFLSAQLRNTVQVTVLSVEQLTYEEYIRSLPDPSIITIFSTEPLEGNALMEIQPAISFGILDRLLGGPGHALSKYRPLTEIERTLLERVSQGLLDFIQEAWENITKLVPKVEYIETNPQFAQIVSPMEMVILVSLGVKIGKDLEGAISFCIPYIVLEPVVDRLNAHYWFSRSTKEKNSKNIFFLQKQIKETNIDVRVILGKTLVTVKELLELQVGDVVHLDQKVTDDLFILIGDRLKYSGKPGTLKKNLGFQITKRVEEGGVSAD